MVAFSSSPAIAQSADVAAQSRANSGKYGGGCYPDIDPKTGFPYPVCPQSVRNTALLQKGDDKEIIDRSADAYKRMADTQKDSGTLSERDWEQVLARVQDARLHARGEVEATLEPEG